MTDSDFSTRLPQILMVILVAGGIWIDRRERQGKPASPAFTAFFTVGGRQGSFFWSAMLILWCVGGLLPVFAFAKFGWTAPVYLVGLILLAGKAMGFWRKR